MRCLVFTRLIAIVTWAVGRPGFCAELACEGPQELYQAHSLIQRGTSREQRAHGPDAPDDTTTEDSFDCDAGFSNWEVGWSTDKKEWCCEVHQKGCKDIFDCDAGYSSWETGWSWSKKAWCCKKYQKGCQATFDCEVDYANWEAGWSNDKKRWCCEKHHKACKEAFDCDAGYDNWEAGWSSKKKDWCCKEHQKGCEIPEPESQEKSSQPVLRLELRLSHRLTKLHEGPFGPAPKLLEDIRSTLCEAAELPCRRLVLLDIRGEHVELNLLGLDNGVLQKFFDKLESVPNFSVTGTGDAIDQEFGVWLEIRGTGNRAEDTTIDIEIVEGEPPAMRIFWVWKDQIGNESSKLRQGHLGNLFRNAELVQVGGTRTASEAEASLEAFREWQASDEVVPGKSRSFTSVPYLFGIHPVLVVAVALLAR